MWWATAALAVDLAPYLPAAGGPAPEWVVRSSTTWLRDGADCLPVKPEDASRAVLFARVCERRLAADGGDDLVCDRRFGVADGWEWRGAQCRIGVAGPSGTRTYENAAPPPVLSASDDRSATWSPRVTLTAVIARPMVEVRSCDPASLDALRREAKKRVGRDPAAQDTWMADRGVVDGVRRCDVSDGVAAEVVVQGRLRKVTPGTRTASNPADCLVPCPPVPAVAALAAAQAELAGRAFYDPAAPTLRLYADRAACEASPPAPSVVERDLCDTLGAELDAAR
ncbi:MAG: hypothetical protein ABMA64_12675 [Myxococcota bacterium]